MRKDSRYWIGAATILLGLLSGCREELGPEQFNTTRVIGKIVVGGRPVDKGWIEFLPADGTVGRLRSAPIRTDGTFEAERVAVGWNRIGLVNVPLAGNLSRAFHPLSSPIHRKISASGGAIEIDLLVELQKEQVASPKP